MQGLAIDPAQRYANAEQLYQALYETSMEQTGSVSMMTHSGISQMLADMQADRKKQAHRKKTDWYGLWYCSVVGDWNFYIFSEDAKWG